MAGISSKAAGKLENKTKYQQYEFNNDLDINLYESFYRTHDPQLGRFWQVDPKPRESESPYVAMGDNPISNVDPKGDYFFGLFGSTSEQRKGARAFAAETGGEVNNITSKNVSVSFAKTIDEKTGDVAVGKTSFHKDGFAKVFGSEAHQVFKTQSWALEHGTGRIDPLTGAFQSIPANGQANMVDDPITMLGPGLLRGLFTKLATAAAKGGTETIYRAFGGESGALGKSWSPINPNSVGDFRNAAGLPNVNTGRFVIEGTVKESNILLRRGALPLDGNKGGIMEYIIKDPSKIIINRVSGVNPEF